MVADLSVRSRQSSLTVTSAKWSMMLMFSTAKREVTAYFPEKLFLHDIVFIPIMNISFIHFFFFLLHFFTSYFFFVFVLIFILTFLFLFCPLNCYNCFSEESDHCKARSIQFLDWLNKRPEKCIAVVTHSSFLRHLFSQVRCISYLITRLHK